jgi:Spy/CpxP family protein refolding chaperone
MKHAKMAAAGVIVLTLMLAASLTLAQAPSRMGRGDGDRDGPGGPCYNVPNLTQEQVAEMTKLRTQFYNDTAALRGQMVTRRIELRALLTNPEATPDQIAAKQRELLQLRTQLGEKRIANQAKMRGLFTKEQLSQMGKWGPGTGFGRGWMHPRGHGQGMMGYGPGGSRGPDDDGRGPYSDWNCPRW